MYKKNRQKVSLYIYTYIYIYFNAAEVGCAVGAVVMIMMQAFGGTL